ncbi:MAG TPA: CsgG/HfaB family protein [Gemmatimonadaceae bacterium]
MRARTSVKALVVAASLIAAPALAAAQANSPVVAVLYFDNNSFGKDRGDFDGLGKGIADLLINDMASNPSMRVVERDRIQSILQEQSLVQSKSIDPQTAVRLGKLLGAGYMITGGFMSDSKGTLLVTSRVINVETGAITNPVKLQSKGDDVLGLIGQLSTKLNTELKLPAVTRTGDAGTKQPASTGDAKQAGHQAATMRVAQNTPAKSQKLDVKTALLYSKALDEQDNGNPQKAAELYRAVLQKFPDFGPAQQNLAKVQKSGH